jgi:hypothetical protein
MKNLIEEEIKKFERGYADGELNKRDKEDMWHFNTDGMIGIREWHRQSLNRISLATAEKTKAETIREILQILDDEDDWMEMHKVQNNYESGIRVGFSKATRIINNFAKLKELSE